MREDLLNFARQMFEYYLGQNGLVTLRISLEATTRPELLASVQEQGSSSILAARAIVHRGIARGELPAGTSPALVTDMVAGAILNHVLATPLHLREQMSQQLDRYVEDLIDLVLTAVQYRQHPSSAN